MGPNNAAVIPFQTPLPPTIGFKQPLFEFLQDSPNIRDNAPSTKDEKGWGIHVHDSWGVERRNWRRESNMAEEPQNSGQQVVRFFW